CSAMSLRWKTRNSRGERMPDGVIRRVSERFFHVRAVRAKILYFAAKDFGQKVKSGSQLAGLAYGYSTLAHVRVSGVKTRESHRQRKADHKTFFGFSYLAETCGLQRRCYDFPECML
ncbi:MAG: hypothetical protein WAN04_16185, partial [Candidatus Udaeobacter sp.]